MDGAELPQAVPCAASQDAEADGDEKQDRQMVASEVGPQPEDRDCGLTDQHRGDEGVAASETGANHQRQQHHTARRP